MDTIVPTPVSLGLAYQVMKVLEKHGIGAAELQRFIDDLSYRSPIVQAFRPDLAEPVEMPQAFNKTAMVSLLKTLFPEDYRSWRMWGNTQTWIEPWDENPFEMFADTGSMKDIMRDLTPAQQQVVVLRSGLAENKPVSVEDVAVQLGTTVKHVNQLRSEAKRLMTARALKMGQTRHNEVLEAARQNSTLSANARIELLDLSPRIIGTLKSYGQIAFISELQVKTLEDIRDIRNMGENSVKELVRAMAEFGLSLRKP